MGSNLQRLLEERKNSGGGGGFSVTGFLGNLVGDVGEIAKGLGGLAVNVGHDAGTLFMEGLTRSTPLPDASFDQRLDDVAKALPKALAQDYSARYGGKGLDEVGRQLYENPLSYVGDALAVASGGGYLAAKGAQGASRIGGVGDDLARMAAGASDIGPLARAASKVLPGLPDNVAAQRAGVAVGDLPTLGGTRNVLDELGRLKSVERATNPTSRVLREGVTDKLLSRPVGKLEGELDRHIVAGEPVDAVMKANMIDLAQANDINRVLRPAVARHKQRQTFAKMMGEHSTAHVALRDERIRAYESALAKLPEDEMDKFHLRTQGLEPTPGAGRLGFDEIPDALNDPALLNAPMGQTLRDTVAPFVERIRKMESEGIDPTEIEAMKRLTEWVAGEPLAAMRAGMTDTVADVIDEVRLVNFSQETMKLLDSGVPAQNVFERALKPLNAYMKREVGSKGWDFDTPDEAFALDDALRSKGYKAPVYFPHIDPIVYSRSDFLLPWRMFGMRKAARLKGARRSEGVVFNNYLDGLERAYVTNPRDAFAQRAAEVVRHEEVDSFIDDMTRSMGRPVTARDQVMSSEVLVNLDGVRTAIRTRVNAMEDMADEIANGASREEAFISAMTNVFANIDDNVAAAAAAKGSLWAVPKTVATKMQQVAKSRIGGSTARLLIDAPNNVWRAGVLYWRPGFYVNNVFGNTVFLKLQGGKMNRMLRQLDKKYKAAFDNLPGEVKAAIEGTGFHSRTGQRATHLGAAEGTTAGAVMKAVNETPVAVALRAGTDQGRRFNNFIENTYRKESFLKGVEKELSKRGVKKAGGSFIRAQKRLDQLFEAGADPQIAKGAIEAMDAAMNNYAALGPIERNIVRRFFMPFWPFYKHATKTLVKMPIKHPAKARLLDMLYEVDQEMADTMSQYLPEWIRQSVPLTGDYQLTQGGMNPFAGIGQNPLAQLNPMLQLGLETATGRDVFTQKPLTSANSVAPFGSDKQYRYDPDTGQAVETTVRPLFDDPLGTLLGFSPQAELIRDLLPDAGARYSTGETITDPNGQPLYPTDRLSEILRYLGIPVSSFDVEGYASRRQQDAMRALQELQRRGLAP